MPINPFSEEDIQEVFEASRMAQGMESAFATKAELEIRNMHKEFLNTFIVVSGQLDLYGGKPCPHCGKTSCGHVLAAASGMSGNLTDLSIALARMIRSKPDIRTVIASALVIAATDPIDHSFLSRLVMGKNHAAQIIGKYVLNSADRDEVFKDLSN